MRRYAAIDNAVPGITRWMMRDGKAGTTIVLSHLLSGKEIGFVKMTATGKLRSEYIWERG
jgi:hypothetical protein